MTGSRPEYESLEDIEREMGLSPSGDGESLEDIERELAAPAAPERRGPNAGLMQHLMDRRNPKYDRVRAPEAAPRDQLSSFRGVIPGTSRPNTPTALPMRPKSTEELMQLPPEQRPSFAARQDLGRPMSNGELLVPPDRGRGNSGVSGMVADVARMVPRGLAEAGYGTFQGLAALDRMLALPGMRERALAEEEKIRADRAAMREFYGNPETPLGDLALLGGSFVGTGAQFAVPGLGLTRIAAGLPAGSRVAAALARIANPLGGTGARAAAGRAIGGTALNLPLNAALAASPEDATATFLADVTDSPMLDRLAESYAGRLATELGVDVAGNAVVEGIARGAKGSWDDGPLPARELEPPTASQPAEGRAGLVERLRRRLAEIADPSIKPELERRDIAEREANTNPVSGLPNRRAYERALETANADPETAVLRFDVNNFKAVNDNLGHGAGDAVLRTIGTKMQQVVGTRARVFHPSGDEFAVLVPKAEAEAIRDAIEQAYGVVELAPGVKTSISGGIGDTDELADLAALARKELQRAEQGIPKRGEQPVAPEPATRTGEETLTDIEAELSGRKADVSRETEPPATARATDKFDWEGEEDADVSDWAITSAEDVDTEAAVLRYPGESADAEVADLLEEVARRMRNTEGLNVGDALRAAVLDDAARDGAWTLEQAERALGILRGGGKAASTPPAKTGVDQGGDRFEQASARYEELQGKLDELRDAEFGGRDTYIHEDDTFLRKPEVKAITDEMDRLEAELDALSEADRPESIKRDEQRAAELVKRGTLLDKPVSEIETGSLRTTLDNLRNRVELQKLPVTGTPEAKLGAASIPRRMLPEELALYKRTIKEIETELRARKAQKPKADEEDVSARDEGGEDLDADGDEDGPLPPRPSIDDTAAVDRALRSALASNRSLFKNLNAQSSDAEIVAALTRLGQGGSYVPGELPINYIGGKNPRIAVGEMGHIFKKGPGTLVFGKKEIIPILRDMLAKRDAKAGTPVPPPPEPERPAQAVTPAVQSIQQAKTGQPFRAQAFRGEGGNNALLSRARGENAVLGPARYSAFDEADAKAYAESGDGRMVGSIRKVDVDLENPLVLDSDAVWREWTRKAGWQYSDLTGLSPEEQKLHLQALRKAIDAAGHDGVIVRLGDTRSGDNTKRLARWFSVDQAIEFRPKEAPAQRAASTETRTQLKRASGPPVSKVRGRPGTVILSDGRKVNVRYDVIEARDLKSSHNPNTFQPTEGYPAGVQGRDYLRDKAAQDVVKTRGERFEPDLVLDASVSPDKGAPIITPDGIVLAGNERSMLIRRAPREKRGDYRNAMVQRAGEFGLDQRKVSMMADPVLVRVLDDAAFDVSDINALREFNRLSDTPDTKVKTAADDAASRAAKMRDAEGALAHYNATIEGDETLADYLGRADGRTFVQKLVDDGVIAPQERARYVDPKSGAVTEEGKTLVRRMMLAAAVDDAGAVAGAPAGVLGKLEHAVPHIIPTRRNPVTDIGSEVEGALRILTDAKAKGMTIDDLIGQGSLLDEAAESPRAYAMAKFLESKTKREITEAFRKYGTAVREAEARAEANDMFGDMGASPEDVRRQAFSSPAPRRGKQAARADQELSLFVENTQADIFGRPPSVAQSDVGRRKPAAPARRMYHGSVKKWSGLQDGIIYLTDDKGFARSYAERGGGSEVVPIDVPADVRLAPPELVRRKLSESPIRGSDSMSEAEHLGKNQRVIDELRAEGYDGAEGLLDFGHRADFEELPVTVVFNARRLQEGRASPDMPGKISADEMRARRDELGFEDRPIAGADDEGQGAFFSPARGGGPASPPPPASGGATTGGSGGGSQPPRRTSSLRVGKEFASEMVSGALGAGLGALAAGEDNRRWGALWGFIAGVSGATAANVGLRNFRKVKEVQEAARPLIKIARDYAKALNVPLRQGRFNAKQRRALGVFFPHAEVARVVRYDDLRTVSHEVGHYISSHYMQAPTRKGAVARGAPPVPKAVLDELAAAGRALYGTRKPKGGYREEGIAEYFAHRVTEPDKLPEMFPQAHPFFEKILNEREPLVLMATNQAAADYKRFKESPASARVASMISVDETVRYNPTLRDYRVALDSDLTDIDIAVQSLRPSMEEGVDNPATLARLARGYIGAADEMMKRGIEINGQRVTLGLEEILRKLSPEDMPYEAGSVGPFREYLVAERTLEVAGRGIDTGIKLADAKRIVAQYRERFEPLAQELWDISNALLDYRVSKGLLTPEEARTIKQRNKKRVPLYRVFGDDELGGSAGRGPKIRNSSGIKTMKGSAREIIDPIEGMVKDIYDTVREGMEHEARMALVRMADDTPGGGRVARYVPAPKEVQSFVVDRNTVQQMVEMGMIDEETAMEILSGMMTGDIAGMLHGFRDRSFAGGAERKDLVFPAIIDGKRRWVEIEDKGLYQTLMNLNRPERTMLENIVSWPARALRTGATTTLDFTGINVFRDAAEAFARTRSTRPVVPLEHMVRGLLAGFQKGDLYQQWRLLGGDNADLAFQDRARWQRQLQDIRATATQKGWRVVTRPLETARWFSGQLERATRLGEFSITYGQQRRRGRTARDAGSAAANFARSTTTDFAEMGTLMRQVNNLAAFSNAQYRGVRNFVTDLKERPMQVVPRVLAGVTLPALYLYMTQRDDPVYQELGPEVRDKFFAVVWPPQAARRLAGLEDEDAQVFLFPKAFEYGTFFGTIPERVAEFVHREDPEALRHAADAVYEAVVPNVIPNAVVTGAELAFNRDTFGDRPIVPRSRENLDPALQYTARTGETARLLGKTFGVAPAKIEHGVRRTFGGHGTTVLGAADKAVQIARARTGKSPLRPVEPEDRREGVEKVPGLRRFVRPAPGVNDSESVNRFYDRRDRATRALQTYRTLKAEGQAEEAARYLQDHLDDILLMATDNDGFGRGMLRQADSQISDLRELRRTMLTTLTGERRKEALRKVDRAIIRLSQRTNEASRTLSEKLRARRDSTNSGGTDR